MRLSRKKFESWLKSKKPNAIVGRPCHGENCPLARYLNEATERNDCSVGITSYRLGNEAHQLPQWGSDFVEEIDRTGRDTRIIANKALSILRSV